MKPSDRIIEIRTGVIEEFARRDAANESADFLMAITGTTAEQIAEGRRADPLVLFTSIIAYLDEQYESRKGQESAQPT